MSDDTEQTSPSLRREALLPNERSRGLGTVAVVCTMAGVASGLALATTLMAMQVADNMSLRSQGCSAQVIDVTPVADVRPEHGFLGVRYIFHHGVAVIDGVLPGTPAETTQLHVGDHVIAIDGNRIESGGELQERIFGSHPGATLTLTIERDDHQLVVHPTLIAWPQVTY
jgi:S1-C subfamily serine protease